MDPHIARSLLRDLAARTLVAAYVERDGGRSLTKIDPATGVAATETEPAEVVRAVLQWHGAGWAGEIAPGWHCFVDDRYLFSPGPRSDLRRAVDVALALVDEVDAEQPAGGVGDLHLAPVVVGVRDMARAVAFWTAALAYLPRDPEPDPDCTVLLDPAGEGPPLSLQAAGVPASEPVRLRLDLHTCDPAGQVARLVDLGATQVLGPPRPLDAVGIDLVVLRDPDGNEFCVIDHAEE